MNVVELKNASVSYRNSGKTVIAVECVSFNVKKGSYLCIIGSNGSGKSSLINAIVGIVPLSSGKIKLNVGVEKLSYLSQSNSIPLDFPATVKEVVLCGMQQRNKAFSFYSKEDYKSVDYAMDLLGISDLGNRRFGELSGGQQQRALLARVMCRRPELLILDEPFGGLDTEIAQSMYDVLQKLHNDLDTTVIMVSHDMQDVKKYATDVVELNKYLMFSGTRDRWIERKGRD